MCQYNIDLPLSYPRVIPLIYIESRGINSYYFIIPYTTYLSIALILVKLLHISPIGDNEVIIL